MIMMPRGLVRHPAVPAITHCLLRCAAIAILAHD